MRATQSGVVVMQNAAAATGNGTVLPMDGAKAAMLQVTGTFVGTITFEATVDGSNWVTYALSDLSTAARTHATTQTTTGIYVADDGAGLAAIRARISAYTSGAITVVGNATA
jgi:hypothetical protein